MRRLLTALLGLVLFASTAFAQSSDFITSPRFFGDVPKGKSLTITASDGDTLILAATGTTNTITALNGNLELVVGASGRLDASSPAGTTMELRVTGIAADKATFSLYESTNARMVIVSDWGFDQNVLGVFAGAGNQLILSSFNNVGKDHDHAETTNPTLFVHSDTDPDTANDEWISFEHDVTNGVIAIGSGVLTIPELAENTIKADEVAVMHDSVIFCGDLENAGTNYYGPAQPPFIGDFGADGGSDDKNFSNGGTLCSALDNTTEATADAPLTGLLNTALKVTGMRCYLDIEPAADVVFTARSAAADLTPSVTCTVAAAGTVTSCSTTVGSTTDVAAGATVAVKSVTTDNESVINGWCKLYVAIK